MLIYSPFQINLPDSVTKRFGHSMSTYYISKERFWIVVTGGYDNTVQSVTGFNTLAVTELGMIINKHIM